MKPDLHLVFSYFDAQKGPDILVSLPETIPEKLRSTIKKIFDLEFENPFFEYTLSEEDLKITNFNFEIPSPWARGYNEMVMLSVITERDIKNEHFYGLIEEISKKIKSIVNIYKSFYIDNTISKKDAEVDQKYFELREVFSEYRNMLLNKVKELKIMELVSSKKLTLSGAYKVFGSILIDIIAALLQFKSIVLCGDADSSNALFALLKRIFLEIYPIEEIIEIQKDYTENDSNPLVINTGLGIVESGEISKEAHTALNRYLQEADKTGDNDAAIIYIRQKLSILLKTADVLEKVLRERKSVKRVIKEIKSHLKIKTKVDELYAVTLILMARGKKEIADRIVLSKLDKF